MKTCYANKRIAAFLLAICMTLSMLPIYASAQEAPLDNSEQILIAGGMGPLDIGIDDVCAIGETGYASLTDALEDAADDDTITLLKSFTHNDPVTIEDIDITFNLEEGSLTIEVDSGTALTVKNCAVTLEGSGFLDVKGEERGVYADNATVTVRYAEATNDTGAYAENGGDITVLGDAKGYSIGACAYGTDSTITVEDDAISTGGTSSAVKALYGGHVQAKNAIAQGANSYGVAPIGSDSTVVITQNATGVQGGVWAQNGATVTVGGDVTGDGDGSIGAWANTGAQIIIDGEVYGESEYYVKVGDVSKTKTDRATEPVLEGYHTYSDGTSTVWVKDTGASTEGVCQIGEKGYASLDAALLDVPAGGTIPTVITLLESFSNDGLVIDNKKVSINLNNNVLTLGKDSEITVGLEVKNGGSFIISGTGQVNAVSKGIAVKVEGTGSYAVVSNATSTNHIAAYAHTGGEITVLGDVMGKTRGVTAGKTGDTVASQILVNGSVTVIDDGLGCVAVEATRGSVVTVDGDVTATGVDGIGVSASGTSSISVLGNVTATQIGVKARDTAQVTVKKDVTAGQSSDKFAYGVDAQGRNAQVTVDGNVSANNHVDSIGALARNLYEGSGTAKITINGELSGKNYIQVGNTKKTREQMDVPSADPSYDTYTVTGAPGVPGNQTVWVKRKGVSVVPTAPQNFTATPGDGQAVLSWEAPASDGGSAVTAYQVSKDNGVNWTDAGLNTTHTFTSLTNGTEYTFKVRAVNSAGNGAEASATATPTAVPTGPNVTPANLNITAGGTGTFTISLGQSGNEADSATVASNDTSIATVNPVNVTTSGQVITVTGVSAGNTTVTISFSGGSYTGGGKTVSVTVTDHVYAVNFYNNGSLYAGKTVTSGSALGTNWPDNPTRSGYSFGGWYTGQNGTGILYTSATVITADVDLYAKWTYSGGGGGGSSTPTTPSMPTYKADVKAENGTETTLPVTVDEDAGAASVDAGSQGLDQGGTVIMIPSIPDVETYSVGIPVPDLSTTDVQGTLTVNTDVGNVTVPSNMLTGVSGISGSKAEISIGQGDKDNLPGDVKAAIGDRPLVQLTLSIDGKQTEWSNPNAPVTGSIPYMPTAEELANPESIVIWYIDGGGNVVTIPNGRYDATTGTVSFFTTHFSDYAVTYVHKTFSDLGSVEWARNAIEVMASKGISNGTGDGTTFSPGVNITRADFMVLLIKTLGLTAEFTGNFDDVQPGAYYYDAIGVAKKLGIAAGSGNNLFKPTESISKQDMMVLAARALGKYQGLKAADNSTVLDKFSDKGDIAEYALNSLATLVDAGLIADSGDKLNPRSFTPRAEVAVFLYNIYNKYPEAPVIAASTVSRLAGQSRIDTALSVAGAAYPDKITNAVLATADNYPDALAGSVLAYQLNAPILLVGSSEADQEKVISYLKANLEQEGSVYILGGTGVIGQGFADKLSTSAITNISRIDGNDRYDTSVKIAEQLNIKTGTPVVLASGENYPDALAVSSIAAQNGSPILLVQKDGISDAVSQKLAAIKPDKIYIIGLEGAISEVVESQASKLTGLAVEEIVRIGGADRYATSLAVAEYFNLGSQTVCIATGNNFPDALAGSVYAAKFKAPIILTGGTLPAQTADYVKSRKPSGTVILGGEAVVDRDVEQQIQQLLK